MNRLTELTIELLYQARISPPWRQSGGRFVLVFHGVSSKRHKDIPANVQPQHSADELRQSLMWLKQYYRFLSPSEFFAGEAGLLLTFDDGFANNYCNALPILEAFNAPAIFFVPTQHIRNPKHWFSWIKRQANYWGASLPPTIAADFYDGMSEKQVIAAAQHPLITIGAHTHSHPILTEISRAEVEREIRESRAYLESLIQQAVDYFAYPKGRFNQTIAAQVQAAGYQAAFGLKEIPKNTDTAFALPRVDLYHASPAYLTLKLSKLSQKPL